MTKQSQAQTASTFPEAPPGYISTVNTFFETLRKTDPEAFEAFVRWLFVHRCDRSLQRLAEWMHIPRETLTGWRRTMPEMKRATEGLLARGKYVRRKDADASPAPANDTQSKPAQRAKRTTGKRAAARPASAARTRRAG